MLALANLRFSIHYLKEAGSGVCKFRGEADDIHHAVERVMYHACVRNEESKRTVCHFALYYHPAADAPYEICAYRQQGIDAGVNYGAVDICLAGIFREASVS